MDFLRGPDRNFLVSLSFRSLTVSLSVKAITTLMGEARGGDIDSSSRWKRVSRILGPCFKPAVLLMYIPVRVYCHFELIKQLCRKKKKNNLGNSFYQVSKIVVTFSHAPYGRHHTASHDKYKSADCHRVSLDGS